uniref:Uncharacterized protein n=1 Tax=Tetradesmus obliquus TaxID=3088 RepID=A0A383WNK2_TETOB|eukprot:jgi/Sobl393_1/14232/SZX78754.1
MFYLALLSNRAITTTFKDPLPGFEAACDMPYINWTQPFAYPDGALDLADLYYKGMSENNPERYFPNEGLINSTMYNMTYVVNQAMEHGTKFGFFHDQNLTNYPPSNSEVPYVIAASNRGQTYKLSLNPYHRQQLWSFGLTPETAYMCGFFYLCSPNTAVQELYKPYWEALSRPGLLKIGIMVRVGDSVFQGNAQSDNATAIQLVDGPGDVYFRCAAALEKAYRVPGQEVVWYLMSDSLGFRQAAKNKFGAKVMTDLSTKIVHPDCKTHNPRACQSNAMGRSMQDSIGQLFTYSLADYHIHTSLSGFGRLGAWASGKYNNLFEIENDKQECDPRKPTPHHQSADTWSFV